MRAKQMVAERMRPDYAKHKRCGHENEQAAVISRCVRDAKLQQIRERKDSENASNALANGAVNGGFDEVCDGLLCVHGLWWFCDLTCAEDR